MMPSLEDTKTKKDKCRHIWRAKKVSPDYYTGYVVRCKKCRIILHRKITQKAAKEVARHFNTNRVKA